MAQSADCRFDPTLDMSKCPWARHLTPNCSWWAGWHLEWQPIAVGVWVCVWMGEWVNEWMRSINCTEFWIKALYKCRPFTIHFLAFSTLIFHPWCHWAVTGEPLETAVSSECLNPSCFPPRSKLWSCWSGRYPLPVIVDRPFLFMIRHNPTGSVTATSH